MEKFVRLFAMFLSSLLLFSACKPDGTDGDGWKEPDVRITATGNNRARIHLKGDTAYFLVEGGESYFHAGALKGIREMETYIFDFPALVPVDSDVYLPLTDGDGYILPASTSTLYVAYYIKAVNRDASGKVVNVFYQLRNFIPYEGWY